MMWGSTKNCNMHMDAILTKMMSPEKALEHTRIGAVWIDVRSESEFAKGALPGAINAPILNDEERRLVGICYKNQGQQAAIELGHKLVGGETKAVRIAQWQRLMNNHQPKGLYCWRGGLRSQMATDWLLDEGGFVLPRLQGGYRAVRNLMLQLLDDLPKRLNIHLLGGQTGSGKTVLLKQLVNAIDLEGLANHRGSAFGAHITSQPTTACFEHQLATALLRADCKTRLWLEDEAAYIGALHLPANLKQAMHNAGIVVVQEQREARVRHIFDEYIVGGWYTFCRHFSDQPLQSFRQHYESALTKIQKRLGGAKFAQIAGLMRQAFNHQAVHDDLEVHKVWLDVLLADYYDPMYAYQQTRKSERILFAGNRHEVLAFINQQQTNKTVCLGSQK